MLRVYRVKSVEGISPRGQLHGLSGCALWTVYAYVKVIVPMMMKVDFASIKRVRERPTGLAVTLVVNWVVKPLSMALLAGIFFKTVFASWMTVAEADQYLAG